MCCMLCPHLLLAVRHTQNMLCHMKGPPMGEYLHRVRAMRYFNGAFSPPKTAPTERKPLGGKHGCLVGIGGQISTLYTPRQVPPLLNKVV